MTPLLIALGGGIGAVARWGIATFIPKEEHGFPVGITAVNIVGSLLLGLVVGLVASERIEFPTEALTVGVLGGFTTFSTWMVDIEEAPSRRVQYAIVLIPTTLGLAAAALGLGVGLSR